MEVIVTKGVDTMNELRFACLCQSIKERGQLKPILVRRISRHRYKVIDGRERILALDKLGESSVLAFVQDESGLKDIPIIQISLKRE